MSSPRLQYARRIPSAEGRWSHTLGSVDSPLYPPTRSPRQGPSDALQLELDTDFRPMKVPDGIYAHQKRAHPTRVPFPPSTQTQPQPSVEEAITPYSLGLKPKRKRITPEQLSVLSNLFMLTDTPAFDVREATGAKLGMTNREVQVWFQNRRAKVTRQKFAARHACSTLGQFQTTISSTDEFLSRNSILVHTELQSSNYVQGRHFPTYPQNPSEASSHDTSAIRSQIQLSTSGIQESLATHPRDTQKLPVVTPQARCSLNSNSLLWSGEPAHMEDTCSQELQSPSKSCSGEKDIESHAQSQSGHPSLLGPHRQRRNHRTRTYRPCSPASTSRYMFERRPVTDEERFHHSSLPPNSHEGASQITDDQILKQYIEIHSPIVSSSASSSSGSGCSQSVKNTMNHRFGREESVSSSNVREHSRDLSPVCPPSGDSNRIRLSSHSHHRNSKFDSMMASQRQFCDIKLSAESDFLSYMYKTTTLVSSRYLPPLPHVECAGPGSFPLPLRLQAQSLPETQQYDQSLTLAPLMNCHATGNSSQGDQRPSQRLPSWRSDPKLSLDRSTLAPRKTPVV
ncbi:hypothetical protein CROQUDRAFT_357196 [Cronartium quercuum f. sp. fusiforme G11]|uniref:Homeobox domain-containing protein n=1 Tax=Cronartium quercuum f. sp. fusiforme G11 TaxID=708437 RepID=A0A9P6NAU1_9BASI|nr:hypothetical protein CROQUDRAFT_357196 [Cronartium quercuum f. sp. fusiforme G11]